MKQVINVAVLLVALILAASVLVLTLDKKLQQKAGSETVAEEPSMTIAQQATHSEYVADREIALHAYAERAQSFDQESEEEIEPDEENFWMSVYPGSPIQKLIDSKYTKGQQEEVLDAIADNKLQQHLVPVLLAVGISEGLSEGKEFGILHPKVKPTFRSQAGWCANTIRKNWDRYLVGGECRNTDCKVVHKPGVERDMDSYIDYLGHIYCPVGATNDPTNLNRNWVGNVKFYVSALY